MQKQNKWALYKRYLTGFFLGCLLSILLMSFGCNFSDDKVPISESTPIISMNLKFHVLDDSYDELNGIMEESHFCTCTRLK